MFGFLKKQRERTESQQQFGPRLHRALDKLNKAVRFNILSALHQPPFVLGADEEPEFILQGKLNGRGSGVLVATPLRVFFFCSGAFGAFSIHDLSYDVINATEFTARGAGGPVSLSGPGLTLTVTDVFPPLLCGPLVAYVKSQQQTKQEVGGLHGGC